MINVFTSVNWIRLIGLVRMQSVSAHTRMWFDLIDYSKTKMPHYQLVLKLIHRLLMLICDTFSNLF